MLCVVWISKCALGASGRGEKSVLCDKYVVWICKWHRVYCGSERDREKGVL